LSQPAAFFDFDHTLIHGDAQELELTFSLLRRRLSPVFLARLIAASVLYRHGRMSAEALTALHLTQYCGLRPADLWQYASSFLDRMIRPRFDFQTIGALDSHRRDGCAAFILSASPLHLITPAAQCLGVADVFGTELEVDSSGRVTGKPAPHVFIGERKRETVLRLAAERDLDLAASFAYSDHHADLPFLEAVGHPVAVHPTRKLAAVAVERGWKVLP
jgi:HAD superfamily hydrolase (TIGR01490 family)